MAEPINLASTLRTLLRSLEFLDKTVRAYKPVGAPQSFIDTALRHRMGLLFEINKLQGQGIEPSPDNLKSFFSNPDES